MNDVTKFATKIGAGAAALGLVVTLVATNGGEAQDARPIGCQFVVGDSGRVAAEDAECDLVFSLPKARRPVCSVKPIPSSSFGQSWSYVATETELVVRGLLPGQVFDFECKE